MNDCLTRTGDAREEGVIRLGGLGKFLRLGPHRFGAFLLHLPNFLRLFWRLLKDSRVGLLPKLLLLVILTYVLIPTDFLPDFLIPLGQLDDLLVIFLGLKGFVRLCPPEAVREHVRTIAAGR